MLNGACLSKNAADSAGADNRDLELTFSLKRELFIEEGERTEKY